MPPPTQPGFAYADPGEVCTRFTAAVYSADTRRDTGVGDAYQRALRFAGGPLAGQWQAAGRDGRWTTWAEHRADVDAVVGPIVDALQPTDTRISAQRVARVTVTPLGEDGWRGWTEHSLADCTLRCGGPAKPAWRATGCEIHQAGPR
ncbi:hypothetical protein [Micromonospora sp. NPDC049662]|uniref:hypothetical protein n=1 Tax=Micromonospora sp. NPDC049662 TaxID=3155397 RepID=UPI003423E00E